VNDAAWLRDGRLAVVGNDLTLRLWDAEAGRQLAVLHGHTASVTSVAASPDGRRLFTGAGDGTVRAWDLEALDPGRRVWKLPASAYGLAFSPDGQRVAGTGWEGWVRVWESRTGREIAKWTGHRQSGVRVAWSPDGKWLATTGNDGRVVLWDAATGQTVVTLLETKGQIGGVAFSRMSLGRGGARRRLSGRSRAGASDATEGNVGLARGAEPTVDRASGDDGDRV
jgi:WD40 repeat protein